MENPIKETNKHQIPLIDFTKEEDILKVFFKHFYLKVYETELPGQKLIHQSHPACEYPEAFHQQHGIVVHLQPKQNSLRRMG
ncbi:MAG: hypothetical protein ACRDBG_15375, partial [Waterburya sp.]